MPKEACLIEDLARGGRFSASLRRAGHECNKLSSLRQNKRLRPTLSTSFLWNIELYLNTSKCPCSSREACSLREPNPAQHDAYVFLSFPISYVIQLIPMTL